LNGCLRVAGNLACVDADLAANGVEFAVRAALVAEAGAAIG